MLCYVITQRRKNEMDKIAFLFKTVKRNMKTERLALIM